MNDILSVEAVCYKYKNNEVEANHNISFRINKGEIVGLFGPNGAGKTTLVRQICGTLRVQKGIIQVNNKNISIQPKIISEVISSLNQTMYMHRFLKPVEYITHTGIYRGMKPEIAKKQALQLMEYFDLKNISNNLLMNLSGGERRVVGFLASIIGFRPFVVLDEPTNDIDPEKRACIWKMINHLKNSLGMSFLLVTHNITEAEEVVDRVVVLNHGNIIVQGKPQELLKTNEINKKIVFTLPYYENIKCETLSNLMNLKVKNIDSERFYFYSHNLNVEDNIKLLYSNLNGIKIKDIQIIEPSLQDIYIQIMKEKINNEG